MKLNSISLVLGLVLSASAQALAPDVLIHSCAWYLGRVKQVSGAQKKALSRIADKSNIEIFSKIENGQERTVVLVGVLEPSAVAQTELQAQFDVTATESRDLDQVVKGHWFWDKLRNALQFNPKWRAPFIKPAFQTEVDETEDSVVAESLRAIGVGESTLELELTFYENIATHASTPENLRVISAMNLADVRARITAGVQGRPNAEQLILNSHLRPTFRQKVYATLWLAAQRMPRSLRFAVLGAVPVAAAVVGQPFVPSPYWGAMIAAGTLSSAVGMIKIVGDKLSFQRGIYDPIQRGRGFGRSLLQELGARPGTTQILVICEAKSAHEISATLRAGGMNRIFENFAERNRD